MNGDIPEFCPEKPHLAAPIRIAAMYHGAVANQGAWPMTKNMAQKRAKKAQRRKELVAQKRRVEAQENSLPARVARAAQAPIQDLSLIHI